MSKEVELPDIGKVLLTKRRSSRHIRLRVAHDGIPHISLPFWVSYSQAIEFVSAKTNWIQEQKQSRAVKLLIDGQRVGKSHVLRFKPTTNGQIRTKVVGNEAIVSIPSGSATSRDRVQKAAERVCFRVLKLESEVLLPQRLEQLAQLHKLSYSKVKISKMRSRWGSCNSHKLITLNCYLMQLPWSLIDYVLLHELAHTEVMAHSNSFWALMEKLLPDYKTRRKELKTHHTTL